MNKRILCIVVLLLALALIVTPSAAAYYNSKLPSVRYPSMKIYTPTVNDNSPSSGLLSAVIARNYNSHYNGYIRCFL